MLKDCISELLYSKTQKEEEEVALHSYENIWITPHTSVKLIFIITHIQHVPSKYANEK